MNKQAYLESGEWKGNPYLVQPDGTKRCSSCEQQQAQLQAKTQSLRVQKKLAAIIPNQYSTWFYNAPEFVDGKLPICCTCWDAWSKREARLQTGVLRKCKGCKKQKPIYQFNGNSTTNDLNHYCRSCKSPKIEK